MKSKKRLLKKSCLYVILDKKTARKRSLLTISKELRASAADIIQLRDKESKIEDILKSAFLIKKLLSHSKKIFLINDYLDVAKITDSDGIHLGQSDTSVKIARKILGKGKIIGVSCHNLKQALEAVKEGADYIGIGPIFPTPTKPQYKAIGLEIIKDCNNKVKIPFFVIGKINADTASEVVSAGAKKAAICSAIIKAKNITARVKYFKNILLKLKL